MFWGVSVLRSNDITAIGKRKGHEEGLSEALIGLEQGDADVSRCRHRAVTVVSVCFRMIRRRRGNVNDNALAQGPVVKTEAEVERCL